MKIKKAVILEKICIIIIYLLVLPFGLIGVLFEQITKPFEWIVEEGIDLQWKIGNKLLKGCDKVKDGTIKNKDFIRLHTAVSAYRELKIRKLL